MAQKPATTRIPRQLRESDVHGKGAAEIGWGTPGDFDRCRAFMRRHDVPGYEIDGACANLHRIATGEWPGRNAHKGHLASVAVISLVAAAGPDTSNMIRWEGPLARIESPTGDRRQFPRDVLKYQSFPQPYRFQRQGFQGHQGAITVGVIENAAEADVDEAKAKDFNIEPGRYVWGSGYFLDPDIVPEVKETVHQIEHGVGGPSVDLDSFTAVLSKTLAGETVANMKRGRMRAATHVSVPAFADLRLKVMRPKELTAAAPSSVEFAVNSKGWQSAPIAPREALFDADDAAKRIEAWAQGDPAKMASVFLWIADSPNAPLIGRRGYRLPWGDIIDGKPYLIFHAVYAAAALLQGAHGGLPAIPEDQKGQLRSVITSIYEKLADEFGDDSIVAPWDRVEQQQAAGGPAWDDTVDEYEFYVSSFDAALEEFRRTHRYTERKHPRVPGKPGGRANKARNPKGGEWVDTPHGPHGQIKVGNKWVYPPKRGEKGYRNPEKAVKGIAERGGGKGPTKRGGTRVVRKAKVAPRRERAQSKRHQGPYGDDHEAALRSLDNRLARKRYLEQLDDAEVKSLNKKLGGTELDDDTRDDLETEILRQLDKPSADEAEKEQKRKDEQARKQDKELREIGHPGGRTVVGKKKPAPEKKPEPKKPAPKKEAPKKPEPKKETPAKPTSTTTVGKKEHKLTPAQTKAIEDLKKDPNAKIHPATRKVLEREGLIPKREEKPEPQTPKKPGGSTTVGKKQHKLTPAQEKAIEDLKKDPNAKIHPATRKVLEREGLIPKQEERKPEPKKPEPKPEAPKKPEPKPKPEGPKKPEKPAQTLAAKHKLTENQKAEILSLHRYGPVNIDLMNKQTRAALEKKGLIDAKGNLTEEGKKVGAELHAAAPKPQSVVPKVPDYSDKPQLGALTSPHSPRPVPKSSRPKNKNPDLEGPQRPKAMSRREREIEYLQEQLDAARRIGDINTRQWEESLERAKREGGDVDYYQRGLDQSKTVVRDLEARISYIKGQRRGAYWDTPEIDPKRQTGTPTQEQIDAHVASIMSPDIPTIYKPQVEAQLKHQGKIAPRSLSTLTQVRVSPDQADFEENDNTYAYYQPAKRDITMSHRFHQKPVEVAESLQRNARSDWLHHPEDGTTGFEAVMSHEFGHHVAYRALAHQRSDELLKAIIREYKLPADTPVTYSGVQNALKAHAASIKGQISNYGASSIQELLAETWGEYTNGGKHLRPNVKRVGELMQELAEDLEVRLL